MRLSTRSIRARVKSDLPITFSAERISAHGGLELFGRFVALRGIGRRVAEAFRGTALDGDYGVVRMLLAVVGLLLIGGMRVTHLAFVGTDPMLLRFCGLHRLPGRSNGGAMAQGLHATPARAARRPDPRPRPRRHRAPRALAPDDRPRRHGAAHGGEGRRRRAGLQPPSPEGSLVLPAHRPRGGSSARSCASGTGPGTSIDSHNADGFLRVVIGDLRARFGRRLPIELRMDGAFFMPAIFAFLDGEPGLEYALKVPMWKWLGLREKIAGRRRWTRVDAYVEGFETTPRDPAVGAHRAGRSSTASASPTRAARTSSSISSPRRRPLRVLGRRHQQGPRGPRPLALHGRPRRPREDPRRAQEPGRLRGDPDQRPRGQRRLADALRAHAQPRAQLLSIATGAAPSDPGRRSAPSAGCSPRSRRCASS